MLTRFGLLSVVATLALGACGGGDNVRGSGRTGDGSGSGATSETTTGTKQRRADVPIAQAGLLKVSDLPSGWTATDDDSEESSQAPCQAITDAKRATSARKTTPTFKKGDSNQVEQAVYVFPDEATAERSLAEVSSAETRTCLRDYFAEELNKESEDAEIGDIESGELNVGRVGDETAADRFTIPVTTSEIDIEVDVTLDLLVVRTGRAVSFFTFFATLTPFDEDLRDGLTKTAHQRLETALQAERAGA